MTLTELQTQVLTDLNRSDQTANVSNAVTSAIKHYSMERWYFLEGRAYASLSSSQAFYAVPNDMMNPDNLLITISGSRTPIDRVDYSEMDEHDDGATFGQPTEWCYYQDNIRLY